MPSNSDLCTTRADECAQQAEQSVLSEVKEQFLRSERAWRGLAVRHSAQEARSTRRLQDAAEGVKQSADIDG
jgi:hypothetical protein